MAVQNLYRYVLIRFCVLSSVYGARRPLSDQRQDPVAMVQHRSYEWILIEWSKKIGRIIDTFDKNGFLCGYFINQTVFARSSLCCRSYLLCFSLFVLFAH